MKKQVLEHYDSIADDFTDLSNTYCNSRYLSEISKHVLNSDSVLEVGCGTGLMLSKLKANNKIGCDLSGKLLAQLKDSDFLKVQADAEILPFRDSSFEVVYSINLLEHVPHPKKAISECLRVLKKSGKLILITPNGDFCWRFLLETADILRLKAPEGPHRFLSTDSLKILLKKESIHIRIFRKMVIVPKGPLFLRKKAEQIEQKTGNLGFFHLVVADKI